MTSGGAIPENADYDVIAEPDDTFVGTVNEDFAIESLKGDVFLLGNTAWKVRRVESGRVRVEDAHGQPPTIPFWLGEAPGRTMELSEEVSELREGIDHGCRRRCAREWGGQRVGSGQRPRQAAVPTPRRAKRVPGVPPSRNRVVAERFFDESGGHQLVMGRALRSRITALWGCPAQEDLRSFDFEYRQWLPTTA